MKKALVAVTCLLAMGTVPAFAADIATRPYTKAAAPIVSPIYDWSGLYIGGNGGWGSSHVCWDDLSQGAGPEGCHSATGAVAGGQLGYRWQISSWVFGLEAQGDWANLRGSNVNLAGPTFVDHSRVDAFGLFTGQIGYSWNNALLYAKGGAAVTKDRFDFTPVGSDQSVTGTGSTRWGSTIGAGLEFGFAANWSAGVEYDHLFMGTNVETSNGQAGVSRDRIKQDVDLVTVRLNYRFGGKAVATY
jgi:outer membrane immunogenic protein